MHLRAVRPRDPSVLHADHPSSSTMPPTQGCSGARQCLTTTYRSEVQGPLRSLFGRSYLPQQFWVRWDPRQYESAQVLSESEDPDCVHARYNQSRTELKREGEVYLNRVFQSFTRLAHTTRTSNCTVWFHAVRKHTL